MRFRYRLFAAAGLLILLWCAGVVWDYFDPTSIAHQSMQVQLRLFGSAIYEYHGATGRWPTKLDDLAQTSLPVKSYVWRQSAATLTLLWPQDLKADPRDNARVLLAYTDKGLFNKLGRLWVCWGDLRTEHMRESELRARLAKVKAR